MTSPPNGTPYTLPSTQAQGLANYPHARTAPPTPHKTLYISGTSSRRGDGTYDGITPHPTDGTLILDIRAQTAAVLRNINGIIKGATDGRGGLGNVIDATVFLVDLERDYEGLNEVWNRVWPERGDAPARTTVEVRKLPGRGLLVEIKCTVVVCEE
ncbi:MAG: hypothetical protein M1834_007784 [Cirrosporium novae-zelandiae]|nr:MAG: hypothetical protein M1834_007784 [Cirrosporium novae-zelandiae]